MSEHRVVGRTVVCLYRIKLLVASTFQSWIGLSYAAVADGTHGHVTGQALKTMYDKLSRKFAE